MTDFHVLVPTATTNLIENPSFETSDDGWTAAGATLTRVLTRARFDRYALQMVTDGVVTNEGAYFRIDATGIESPIAGSVYVRGAGRIRLRLIDGFKGGQVVSETITLSDERWQRIGAVGRVGNSDDYRLYVETVSVQAVTLYIDGAQMEESAEITSYCDGEREGCRWNGVSHASVSQRSAEEMSGGIWTPIRDKDCNPDTYVTVFGGFGLPPTRINRQRTALSPGSVFDNATVLERVMTMNIWVKDGDAQNRPGRGQLRIKELRQTLTDLVKLDVSPDTEPFMLKVTDDGGIPLTIRCRYEAGLEFDSDAREKWRNTIPLRLLCLDPFWEEDDQEVAILDTENDLGDGLRNFGRVDELWDIAINDFNDSAEAIAEDESGRLYFGGNFTTDGDGNQVRRFGSTNDDFSLVLERATGLNGRVWDIVAHPNGMIYVCGAFTGDNAGNPFDRIVEYDPVANTFAALAGGIDDGIAYQMSVAPNGNIYVVGTFTTVDTAPAVRIAFWDGGSWHTVGNIMAELDINTLTLLAVYAISDDEVYVGCFALGGGAGDATLLAQWDGSDWAILHLGTDDSGNNPLCRYIIKDVDGTIVYCGTEEDDADSLASYGRVWRWNGSAYTQLGEKFDFNDPVLIGDVAALGLHPSGNIFCTGQFLRNGSLEFVSPIAIWNGSTWVPTDLEINTDSSFGDLLVRENGDVYIGAILVNNVSAAAVTIVENISTTDVFPILTITGTGRLVRLQNYSTGQKVFLDYVLQENEILTLDFREGKKNVTSNYRGSVPDAILPNSDDFFLVAGELGNPKKNEIGLLITDEVAPTAQLRYTPIHWSIDAGAS